MTRKTLLTYGLIAVCLLPIYLLRDYTPANELRYLSIADEAWRDGHFLVFSNHGDPYADKPPLFLWIVMAVRLLPAWLQHVAFAIVGLVPAIMMTEVAAGMARLSQEGRTAFRLIMFSTSLTLVSMLTLRMDTLMTMFIVLAVAEFARLYHSGRPHESWRLPVYVFLAVFTKGGVGFLVPFAVILAFLVIKGRTSDFFRYVGPCSWTLLLGLFGLWFLGVYLEGGGAYLYDLTVHQTLGRTFHSFHHRQPFYYYLYMIWPLLMPWSLWVVASVIRSLKGRSLQTDSARLMTIATLTVFVVLSLVSSKLSIYLLPLVPFALAVAVGTQNVGRKTMLTSLSVPYLLLLAVMPAYLYIIYRADGMGPFNIPLLWLATLAVTVGAAVGLVVLWWGRTARSISIVASSLLVCAFFVGLAMPKINPFIGYRDLCQVGGELSRQHGGARIVTVGINRSENMDVWLGYSPRKVDGKEASRLHHTVVLLSEKKESVMRGMPVRRVGNHFVAYVK